MVTEDKIKERALLLMRFYYSDDIFDIGKNLRIAHFSQYKSWWEIDYSKRFDAALEIAKILSDQDLIKLTKEKPPRYKLGLGGFQGNFYSCSEAGEVKLESSRDSVRENIKKALEKGGDKAYGVLKGIINKEGKASYFDLIDAIEQVLGYEFVPSYLLPRLAPLKLIFKTGSNKYPDWTMPPEIIPVVKQELLKYEATRHKPTQPRKAPVRDMGRKLIQTEHDQRDTVNQIIQQRRNINLLFDERYGIKLFKQNEQAIIDITKPCAAEEDFNNRVLSLANLVTEIETEEIKKHLKVASANLTGSINILGALLKEISTFYDQTIIKNLRMIQTLRSKKFPIHVDTPEFIEALKYFGFPFPVTDWQALWDTVLQKYLESLNGLEQCLKDSRGH